MVMASWGANQKFHSTGAQVSTNLVICLHFPLSPFRVAGVINLRLSGMTHCEYFLLRQQWDPLVGHDSVRSARKWLHYVAFHEGCVLR